MRYFAFKIQQNKLINFILGLTCEINEFQSDCRKDFINPDDFEKVQVTFKQFYRDWSEEGADERNICYKPIIQEIVNRFPADSW